MRALLLFMLVASARADFIVIWGQSNAAGYPATTGAFGVWAADNASVDFYATTNGAWGDLVFRNANVPGQGANKFPGPEISIANLRTNLAIIKHGRDGYSLASNFCVSCEGWITLTNDITTAYNLMPAQIARTNEQCAGIVQLQGESDSNLVPSADAYEINQTNVIVKLRTHVAGLTGQTATNIPYLILGTSRSRSDKPGNSTVRAAQQNAVALLPNVSYVDSSLWPKRPDYIHYEARGLMLAGYAIDKWLSP